MRDARRFLGMGLLVAFFLAGAAACDSSSGEGSTDVAADTSSDAAGDPCAAGSDCDTLGATVCADTGSVQTCEELEGGCLRWSAAVACGTGEICSEGACSADPCAGRECGDDGQGGSCGTCETGYECDDANGTCVCTPQCDGRECGDDGCGASCGDCEAGEACTAAGTCCTPNCTNPCGDDGCGGTCDGICPTEGEACSMTDDCNVLIDCIDYMACWNGCGSDSVCLAENCDARTSFDTFQAHGALINCVIEYCAEVPDDQFGACITAQCGTEYETCFHRDEPCGFILGCIRHCTTSECFGDCFIEGTIEAQQEANDLVDCLVEACPEFATFEDECVVAAAEEGGACGDAWGTCEGSCTIDCDGKECGPDGCGWVCGTCEEGYICNESAQCELCVPACDGKNCGDNGCGGVCGTCDEGWLCEEGVCTEVVCALEGHEPAQHYGELAPQSEGFIAIYSGPDSTTPPFSEVWIEIYATPQYGGPSEPGTFELWGENYADCGLCVLGGSTCDGSSCNKVYLARAGSLELTAVPTAVDEAFGGTFSNLVLSEVQIQSGTYESTFVEDGANWCIEGFSFYVESVVSAN